MNLLFTQDFLIQILFCIASLFFIVPYYFSYKIVLDGKIKNPLTVGKLLYISGLFSSIIWFIMPFLKQPRFSTIFDYIISGEYEAQNLVQYISSGYGLIFTLIFMYTSFQAIKVNLTVTRDNFSAPKKLLTDGIYAKTRHPMLAKDFLCHFFFAVSMGSIYTIILMPVYYFINIMFINIQEKLILKEKFRVKYAKYSKNTPKFFDFSMWVIFILGFILILGSFY